MKTFLNFFLCLWVLGAMAQNPKKTPPCERVEAHQFDFWIGDWVVYKNNSDTIVGYNKISPVAGNCALLEDYTTKNKQYKGNSINKYNFAKKKWQQMWVDNSGLTLELEGSFADNKMILEGEQLNFATGKMLKNRITWFKHDDGTVRQLWEQSQDDGKTYQIAFDGLYKKKL
jgi:hypothetical protein